MERVFQPKEWGRDPFAGSLEADDRFLLAFARQHEQIAGLSTIESLPTPLVEPRAVRAPGRHMRRV
jgi:hypothetical protein